VVSNYSRWKYKCTIRAKIWKQLTQLNLEIADLRAKIQEELHGAGSSLLTPTELRVYEQVRYGRVNKEIANELNISMRTVKFHVSSLLKKFNATSRKELLTITERGEEYIPVIAEKTLAKNVIPLRRRKVGRDEKIRFSIPSAVASGRRSLSN
jgi:DNA-binding CsgD family transcriptional regulator